MYDHYGPVNRGQDGIMYDHCGPVNRGRYYV